MPEHVTYQDLADELFKNNEKIRSIVNDQFKEQSLRITKLENSFDIMRNAQTQVLVQQEKILGSIQRMDENLDGLVKTMTAAQMKGDEEHKEFRRGISKLRTRFNWAAASGAGAWGALLFVGGLLWTVANRIYDLVNTMHR